MKKWLTICGIICLLVVWQLLLLYKDFKSTEASMAEHSITVAKAEADMETVQSVDYYPAYGGFEVVMGQDAAGKAIIVWVQDDQVWVEPREDNKTREQILNKLEENVVVKRITPGLIDTPGSKKRPIWEVYYETKHGEGQYAWFDFHSGKRMHTTSLSHITDLGR